ncbi:hypothetical protein C7M84_005425 [Penaeus vannamei]|uniref:Uncharacterized protein n=1 Tax=Penaeus vannamei TaxID=6689 RepID=A0A3R7N365_PENVA|nr:hypothetical protein C7M84_005425 [Penaeus vannamei]
MRRLGIRVSSSPHLPTPHSSTHSSPPILPPTPSPLSRSSTHSSTLPHTPSPLSRSSSTVTCPLHSLFLPSPRFAARTASNPLGNSPILLIPSPPPLGIQSPSSNPLWNSPILLIPPPLPLASNPLCKLSDPPNPPLPPPLGIQSPLETLRSSNRILSKCIHLLRRGNWPAGFLSFSCHLLSLFHRGRPPIALSPLLSLLSSFSCLCLFLLVPHLSISLSFFLLLSTPLPFFLLPLSPIHLSSLSSLTSLFYPCFSLSSFPPSMPIPPISYTSPTLPSPLSHLSSIHASPASYFHPSMPILFFLLPLLLSLSHFLPSMPIPPISYTSPTLPSPLIFSPIHAYSSYLLYLSYSSLSSLSSFTSSSSTRLIHNRARPYAHPFTHRPSPNRIKTTNGTKHQNRIALPLPPKQLFPSLPLPSTPPLNINFHLHQEARPDMCRPQRPPDAGSGSSIWVFGQSNSPIA